jgi:predicted DsbA family dithiol-disulfide isomerase
MTQDATPEAPLTIDVVSDAVCPWCFVGKRRLEAALGELGDLPVEVRWRPFQLDPTIPRDGMSRADYLARKFGPDRVKAMNERLAGVGAEAGIPFAFDRIARSPNTLDAHRLIRWAQASGRQTDIVERLFRAYFVNGEDIGDRDTLARVAGECGLDRDAIRARLDSGDDEDAVREEIAVAQRIGVTGVPFFILDGKFGVAGAQPPEALVAAVRQALAGRAADGAPAQA